VFSGEWFLDTFSRRPARQRRIFSRSLLLEYRCIRRLLRIKPRSFFRVVFAPLESSPFFGVSVQIWTKYLMVCSPISSPTSRGFCTVKRRRFNELDEMTACLQILLPIEWSGESSAKSGFFRRELAELSAWMANQAWKTRSAADRRSGVCNRCRKVPAGAGTSEIADRSC